MDISLSIKALIIGTAVVIGLGSVWFLRMPRDNHVEEIAEEVIHQQTGYDIDLSPGDSSH